MQSDCFDVIWWTKKKIIAEFLFFIFCLYRVSIRGEVFVTFSVLKNIVSLIFSSGIHKSMFILDNKCGSVLCRAYALNATVNSFWVKKKKTEKKVFIWGVVFYLCKWRLQLALNRDTVEFLVRLKPVRRGQGEYQGLIRGQAFIICIVNEMTWIKRCVYLKCCVYVYEWMTGLATDGMVSVKTKSITGLHEW